MHRGKWDSDEMDEADLMAIKASQSSGFIRGVERQRGRRITINGGRYRRVV